MNISIKGLKSFLKRKVTVLNDYIFFCQCIKEYDNKNVYILFSHNADHNGGAPVVLFDYGFYLHNNNNNVIFLVGKGGKLKNTAKENGINCFQIGHLYKLYIRKLARINYRYPIFSTIVSHKYVNYYTKRYNENCLLWIHEDEILINQYQKYIKNNSKIKIACGSETVLDMLKRIRPDLMAICLYYGCMDNYKKISKGRMLTSLTDTISITVIGRICDRKNQIQLIEAIKLLRLEERSKIRIIILSGSRDEKYLCELKRASRELNVEYRDSVPNNMLYKIYAESDIIICPSKDDPLPVVVTNAFMYGKATIVSNKVGQSKFIENGKNGYTFNINSTQELSDRIHSCINSDRIEIGKEARKIFLDNFSMEILHSNIIKILS